MNPPQRHPENNKQTGILNRLNGSAALDGDSSAGAANFSELMEGTDGSGISQVITDSYDVLYGDWPEAYNEVVLVLNESNGISAGTLYQLGLITEGQYEDAVEKIENGEDADEISFDYEEICNHPFYLVPACDHYMENENGTFTYIEDSKLYEKELLENAVELKVSGIIRPNQDAVSTMLNGSIGYTSERNHPRQYTVRCGPRRSRYSPPIFPACGWRKGRSFSAPTPAPSGPPPARGKR